MNQLRAFTATLMLAAIVAACDSPGVTDPAVRPTPAPALDGIGMIGGGGRSAEGDDAGTSANLQGDSTTVAPAP